MMYRINYEKLKHLQQLKLYLILIVFIMGVIFFGLIAWNKTVNKIINCVGVYSDGVLKIEINNKLSDKIKKNNTLIFNGTKTNYVIQSYGNYNLVDQEIYQELYLTIDDSFYDNEVGIVEFHYQEEKVINYILDLFK